MNEIVNEISVKNIITKSNLPICDYSVNPYIGCTHACKYCYASFMKKFTGHTEPWGTFVDVKYWEPLKNTDKYKNKEFFIGSATDPYNPQEAIYKRTGAFLEQIQGSEAKISIQTKSDLVLRDIDLIKTLPNARVGFSINTLDEKFREDMDCAVSISRRIEAMRTLYDAGIRTTCFISPIFPKITDVESIIERVKGICNLIWLENLNLRGDYKYVILGYIRERYPHLISLYDDIYRYGNRNFWVELDTQLSEFTRKKGLRYIKNDDSFTQSFDELPTVVNFFYHEEIKRSRVKKMN